MVPHPFGYITVILIQQMLIIGLTWAITHLVDELRRERRRCSSINLFSKESATGDLAALAVQLSRTDQIHANPAPRRTRVREMQEESV